MATTTPLPTSETPPDSSSSSAAIAAGVGGGLAGALVLLVLATLLVILVVFHMRKRQIEKPGVLEEDRDAGNAMDNPVYTGKPYVRCFISYALYSLAHTLLNLHIVGAYAHT